ncbi:MAG: hypothetical protein M1294_06080 [Firmicutes bacterium]|jgi:hypothetical protein|uniref:AtuA-like ferredoxin-fold domain-containing protein n=1 Tax=Sulfobacillus benefaciens TaxID=453960 RepID=A0A2T2X990_9FIRM|nr:hypothetical protein [Bacillota bacterium]MCL5015442.1 hypothetical protein [Bacillota bacterium]PSR31018.1 MAG: hypothetical protein C7B43_03990 [Sulfobacillus benefaciens]
MIEWPLRNFCQARSGDKGNTVNVAVFAPDDVLYDILVRELTADRVKNHFGNWVKGPARRYEVPNLRALNFVLQGALDGGGSRSIRIDNLGKCFGPAILRLTVPIPEKVAQRYKGGPYHEFGGIH